MDLKYSIDKDLRIVFVTYPATNLSFNEWKEIMNTILHDPDFKPGYCLLLDRRLVKFPPEKGFTEQIAGFIQNHKCELSQSRTAMVVSEMASYGMMRMLQGLLNETERFGVFTDIEKAKNWLLNITRGPGPDPNIRN